MDSQTDRNTPLLEGSKALQRAYDTLNKQLFDDQLANCYITLQREKRVYGYFSSKRLGNLAGDIADEIALNPMMFDPHNLMEFFQTLAHEMCHLWQQHFGAPGRGRYHNKQWSQKMQEIGLMPSSTGKPGGKKTGDAMNDYIIAGGQLEGVVNEFLQDDFALWYDRLHEIMMEQNPDIKPIISNDAGTRPPPVRGNTPTSGTPTRAKFSCPSCGFNAWAKPSGDMSCNPCNKVMVKQESEKSPRESTQNPDCQPL